MNKRKRSSSKTGGVGKKRKTNHASNGEGESEAKAVDLEGNEAKGQQHREHDEQHGRTGNKVARKQHIRLVLLTSLHRDILPIVLAYEDGVMGTEWVLQFSIPASSTPAQQLSPPFFLTGKENNILYGMNGEGGVSRVECSSERKKSLPEKPKKRKRGGAKQKEQKKEEKAEYQWTSSSLRTSTHFLSLSGDRVLLLDTPSTCANEEKKVILYMLDSETLEARGQVLVSLDANAVLAWLVTEEEIFLLCSALEPRATFILVINHKGDVLRRVVVLPLEDDHARMCFSSDRTEIFILTPSNVDSFKVIPSRFAEGGQPRDIPLKWFDDADVGISPEEQVVNTLIYGDELLIPYWAWSTGGPGILGTRVLTGVPTAGPSSVTESEFPVVELLDELDVDFLLEHEKPEETFPVTAQVVNGSLCATLKGPTSSQVLVWILK